MSKRRKNLIPSFLPIHYNKLDLQSKDVVFKCSDVDFDYLPNVFYVDFLNNFSFKEEFITLMRERGLNFYYLDRDNVMSEEHFKKNLDSLKKCVCLTAGVWVVVNSPLFYKHIGEKFGLDLPRHPFFDCKPQKHFFLGKTDWKLPSDSYKVEYIEENKDIIKVSIRNSRDLYDFVKKLK